MNDIMDVYQVASLLGKALVESKEYINLKDTEVALENDHKSKEIYNKYVKLKESLDRNHDKSINTVEMEKIHQDVKKIDIIRRHLEAKEDYNKVLENITHIIEHFTGLGFQVVDEEKSGCCSKKHGCCGSK